MKKIITILMSLTMMLTLSGTVQADHEACALACANFPMSNWEHTCQGGTILYHYLNLTADSNDFNPPATTDFGSCECEVFQPCHLNCTNVTGQARGASCIGLNTICDNQTLPFMAFGANFTLGIGVMLMIAGAGVVGDSIIRSQEKKQKEFLDLE